MSIEISFQDRTVVVTGGTTGIGAAIGEALVEAGAARIIITGVPEEDVVRLRKEAESLGRTQFEYHHVDFSDNDSLNAFLEFLRGLDRVDACVNNAGVNRILPIDALGPDDYDWLASINLRAPLLICGAVAPKMKDQGYGRIVNIASIWASISKPGRAMYTSSKFGIVGLTKTVGVELAEHGVLTNAVSPGFTMTELTRRSLSSEEMDELARAVPARRFAQPSEIAQVVLFLCSDLNSYITGQNITVDGGFISV